MSSISIKVLWKKETRGMTGLIWQPLYYGTVVIDGTFFSCTFLLLFCRPYRLSLWFPLKSLEPQLTLMWPQWHSELWDMRQCPEPATTAANQRCSQICPTCCGPEWLTPLGTTCAHSIRGKRERRRESCGTNNSLVAGLTKAFCFYFGKPQWYFPSHWGQRCSRQWRHQDKIKYFSFVSNRSNDKETSLKCLTQTDI